MNVDQAQVAHDMREYIEKHGWIQGTAYRSSDGAVCLVGALHEVCRASELRSRWDRRVAFSEAFHREVPTESVISWNDAPGRTYEDVITLLKRIETGDVDST